MRGESSTKRFKLKMGVQASVWGLGTGLFSAAMAVAALASCGPGPTDGGSLSSYDGRLTINWTLNGVPLSPTTCQSERITSMNVLVASTYDRSENVEFLNVTCGLDRYSMAMVPRGPVRVYVDAVRASSGKSDCVRYSGQVTGTAGSQFASQPTSVALRFVGSCP